MVIHQMIVFFQRGGLFMYPILLVLAVGVAIAFERWFRLNRVRSVNRKMWDILYPMLAKGDFEQARTVIGDDTSAISQMLGMGLARIGLVRRREDIEVAMEESLLETVPHLEKRTPYLALLSNVATLFGLLGTITGLIDAFAVVAKANPAEKAVLLTSSISVAMNCTAFGLMSAIPLLLLHAKLTSTTAQIVDSLEMALVTALNSISDFNRRYFEAEAETPDENGSRLLPEADG
jgi:biopolymer transport protein ExbB